MGETKRKRLAIIDGKSVFYRGYYAMPSLSTKDGTPTGGVYGFAVMALEVIKRLNPDYVCVAWDKPKTNIRKRLELYPEYKAGRKPAPADFYDQIPLLHELLDAFGWPLYELDDYEADDIMGTLAVQATAQDIETMLVTSDMDMLQLIDLHVSVYALKKGLSNIELYHPESFTEKYGLLPSQFLDLKALKGDSSDNIPGVPGIGEKTAIELLKQHATLDGVYENIELTKESVRKKLEAGRELAYLSKKLAAIWTDAPLKLDLKELNVHRLDPTRVQSQLEKLEFRTLARQLPSYMHVPESAEAKRNEQKLDAKKAMRIDSDEALADLAISDTEEVFIHSVSVKPHGKQVQTITLSAKKDLTYVFDVTKLNHEKLAQKLKPFAQKPLFGYDVKSSMQALMSLGLEPATVGHDVLVGAFLVNSLTRELSLVDLAARDLGVHLEPEQLTDPDFQGEVVGVLRALVAQQNKELEKLPKVTRLAKTIEWPLIPVLAAMEYEGIKLDCDYLHLMREQVDDTISDLEQQVYGFADEQFNISSPVQLAEILFTKLKLPTVGIKRGKTGYSTAATELDKLRGQHPIIDMITQYREVAKLKNTYIDTLPNMVDEQSRLHTTFNLTIAQTGRLSSTDPNLQNIPVRTELGRRIRTAFVAEKGNVLVSADYSQFELRLAAVLAADDEMIDVFNRGVDIHVLTAAQVYGREPEEVTKSMRRDAKVVNFGVMYGLSPHGLTAATGMTYEQAKHFIDKYFEKRPKLKTYIDSVKEKAKKDGYVETIMGRRRPTPDIQSSNFMVREAATRAAVNMPFQGSAADIMKKAMIDVYHQLAERKSSCKMLLQIHDSLIVECAADEGKDIEQLLKVTMEHAYKLPVELTVDTSIGENWGDL